MDAKRSGRDVKAVTPKTARGMLEQDLAAIHGLLSLIDPHSPFQPLIVGSIDLVAWQGLFGAAVAALETHLPQAVRSLPKRARDEITSPASALFSLAHSICDTPQLHISEHAKTTPYLPDPEGLDPDSAASPEEEQLIREALTSSREALNEPARQIGPLRKTLASSAVHLNKTLSKKHGVLRLLLQGLKKQGGRWQGFRALAAELEAAFAVPPPEAEVPWKSASQWYGRLSFVLGHRLLPNIDPILRTAFPKRRPTAKAGKAASHPGRQEIKNTFLRSFDSFNQTYGAVRNMHAMEASYPLWTLFSGLVTSLSACLKKTGVLESPGPLSNPPPRLLDAISTLDERIISRQLLADWGEILASEGDYATQVVLASIHHLERLDDEASTAGDRSLLYAFSEQTASRWLSRGAYPGDMPEREASPTFAAETKRTRRALEHLRHHGAAFHGRRHWTPLPLVIANAKSERLWTINPLLAAHPVIKQQVTRLPVATNPDTKTRETRPRPSRKNRRPQRKR